MVRTTFPPKAECDTLTITELADRLGISRTVAYELAAQDRLPIPAIRIGRQYRFSRHALEILLAGQHNLSPQAA